MLAFNTNSAILLKSSFWLGRKAIFNARVGGAVRCDGYLLLRRNLSGRVQFLSCIGYLSSLVFTVGIKTRSARSGSQLQLQRRE